MEHWKEIIEENRFIAIRREKGRQELLLSHKILEERPRWKELLKQSLITPLTIEYEGNFILFQHHVPITFLDQESYEDLTNCLKTYMEKKS